MLQLVSAVKLAKPSRSRRKELKLLFGRDDDCVARGVKINLSLLHLSLINVMQIKGHLLKMAFLVKLRSSILKQRLFEVLDQ